MSKPETQDLIDRWLRGALDAKEKSQLVEKAVDPEFASELAAQRTVDQLLKFNAAELDQHDNFVSGCVEAFSEQFSIDTRTVEPSPGRTFEFGAASMIAVASAVAIVGFATWWMLSGRTNEGLNQPSLAANGASKQSTEIPAEPTGESVERTNGPESADSVEPKMVQKAVAPVQPKVAVQKDSPMVVASDPGATDPVVDAVSQEVVSSTARTPEAEVAPLLGRIISSRTAQWKIDPGEELHFGEYGLTEGSARLKFDNGLLVRMAAPASFRINEEDMLSISQGELLFDVPRKVDSFSCQIGNKRLAESNNASFLLRVRSESDWESLVTRGSLVLKREEQPNDIVALAKNGLNQLAVKKIATESGTPESLIARGRGKFLGQCFEGSQVVEMDSAENFQSFLSTVVVNRNLGWDRFATGADAFNERLRNSGVQLPVDQFQAMLMEHLKQALPNNFQFSSDTKDSGSTQFRGSMNINGVEKKFDSLEEFNRAMSQGFGGDMRGSSKDESFLVGEQSIEFSTPESFIQSRRKMNK